MKKNMFISLALGMAVSGIALYLAFRNVPLTELINYLASINYLWIFPSVMISIAAFLLRVLRWQIILGTTQPIRFWNAFHPLMIGFMLNCILPGRAGEVARPVILQKEDQVPFSTGLATVAAERVFDISFLIILFGIVMSSVKIDPDLSISFSNYQLNKGTLELIGSSMIKLSMLLIFGIILLSFSGTRKIINGGIMGIPSLCFFAGDSFREKIKEKICKRLVNIVENFASGFSLVKSPKRMLTCLVLSFLIWILSAASYYIFALGCSGITLSYAEMTAVMVIICFFIALPSVPGFWGLWEAGGVFALSLFGIASTDAFGFTLANHAFQMIPVIIIGLISAMIMGINIWQISHKHSADIQY